MLQELPLEILNQISYTLVPSDALHLAYTNKYLYSCLLPRLYSSLVIDSSKKNYQNQHLIKHKSYQRIPNILKATSSQTIHSTSIKSIYALRLVFKNLANHPSYASYIQILIIDNEFPDISNLEITHMLSQIMPLLTNLKVFHWFSLTKMIPFELLYELKFPNKLLELSGNFIYTSQTNLAGFNNLKIINLSSFQNSANLAKFENLASLPNLSKVIISKNFSCNNQLLSSKNITSNSLLTIPDSDPYLSVLFPQSSTKKLNLSSFCLKDINLDLKDVDHLISNINLNHLNELSIKNCTESFFHQNILINGLRRNLPPVTFLDKLTPFLTNLTKLNLDLSNELYNNDSIFKFLSNLPKLTHLIIKLNFNQYENINYQLFKFFINLKPSLTYLNFDFDISSNIIYPPPNYAKPATFNYTLSSIEKLSSLKNLYYLKFPILQFQIPQFLLLIKPLSKLSHLQLVLLQSACETPSPILTNNLICQDYFNTSFLLDYKLNQIDQFKIYALDFKQSLSNLKYLSFSKKDDHFVFDCIGQVHLNLDLVNDFDHLLNI